MAKRDRALQDVTKERNALQTATQRLTHALEPPRGLIRYHGAMRRRVRTRRRSRRWWTLRGWFTARLRRFSAPWTWSKLRRSRGSSASSSIRRPIAGSRLLLLAVPLHRSRGARRAGPKPRGRTTSRATTPRSRCDSRLSRRPGAALTGLSEIDRLFKDLAEGGGGGGGGKVSTGSGKEAPVVTRDGCRSSRTSSRRSRRLNEKQQGELAGLRDGGCCCERRTVEARSRRATLAARFETLERPG